VGCAYVAAPVEKEAPKLCEEIMKDDVQCLSARSTAEEAARAIIDRDIAVRLVAAKKPGTTTVEQLMSRQIISRSPKDDIGLAQELMAANHKSRIVCVNDAGRLVGVISLSDIAQHDPRC
jgi:CBS domain-containing protein